MTTSSGRSLRSTTRRGVSPTRQVDQLVEEHLDLVAQVVHQVAARFPAHVEREELLRAGALGLVEAAQRYDESRAIPFARFAARRIHGAVLDAVRSADWAPRSLRQRAREVERTQSELATRLHRAPTEMETADHLGMDRRDLQRVKDGVVRAALLGLESPSTEADSRWVTDDLADDTSADPSEEIERRELYSYVRSAVAFLSDRHREVVVGYFIEQRSSEELAADLGVTVSRVSQLRSEALATMRRGIEAQYRSEDPADASEGSPRPGVVERRRAAYEASIRVSATRLPLPEDTTDLEFRRIVAGI